MPATSVNGHTQNHCQTPSSGSVASVNSTHATNTAYLLKRETDIANLIPAQKTASYRLKRAF